MSTPGSHSALSATVAFDMAGDGDDVARHGLVDLLLAEGPRKGRDLGDAEALDLFALT